MNKIRTGDNVIVLAGKDKGKRGTVTRVLLDDSKVVIENINVAKKHQKPNPSSGAPGGIVEVEMPIQTSNVAIFNDATGKADRDGIKVLEEGRKVRFFKSNGEVVDV